MEKSMCLKLRNYIHPDDYKKISEFLIAHYKPGHSDGNWIEPIWEYMHGHPYLDLSSLEKIGVWEDDGEIVAVAHYESRLGEAFFEFHPSYRHLCSDMLDHAEANLTGISQKEDKKHLFAYVNDTGPGFLSVVKTRGYEKEPERDRPMCRFDIPNPFPAITLPEGFRLTSLAEECDWEKVHRVMWRGFDHGDDVPMNEEEFESRRRMFDTPKARRDLKVAVAAPNGDFVAFCGMFYEPTGKFAYVEPVATDPFYRRMGLGKAAVLEGIRRCGALGATIAYVGNDLPIYQSIGFKEIYNTGCWVKYFSS
jgi:GNAT superfamily N-acetyltransferase